MFESLRHLLPDSTAWRVVVDRLLRQYLEGLSAGAADEARDFIDDVSDDLYPATTRELAEWQKQFDLDAIGSDASQRAALTAAWQATGGQSPGYIQSILQAAGFDVYVHDWFWTNSIKESRPTGDTISVNAYQNSPQGFCFDRLGSLLFVADNQWGEVYEYRLPAPWSFTGPEGELPVYVQKLSVSAQDVLAMDVDFSGDGKKMFVLGNANNKVYEYDLTRAYDIATATYSAEFSVGTQETVPHQFYFHPDGTRFYVIGTSSDSVHRYDMSTEWDLSTASYVNSFAVLAVYAGAVTDPIGLAFTPDGSGLIFKVLGGGYGDTLFQWPLSTPWDITTATGAAPVTYRLANTPNPFKIQVQHGFLFTSDDINKRVRKHYFGGPRTPFDWITQPTIGTTQAGDVGAECGEVPPGQTSDDSAVCNRFLANDPGYLVNLDLTRNAPPAVPEDVNTWPHFWYVGGPTYGGSTNLPLEDRDRFEKLLLKLGPAHQWIVTMINYV